MSTPILIHPPNQDFLEEHTTYPVNLPQGLPLFIIIPMVGMYILTLFITGIGGIFLYHSNQLFKHPVETTAIIIERDIFGGKNDLKTYQLGYTFEVNGESFTDYHNVDSDTYNDLEIGDPINIYYALNDPNYTRVIGFDEDFPLLGYVLAWVFIAIILGAVSYYMFHRHRRLSMLKQAGKIISDELIDISGNMEKGHYVVTVNAQFQHPDTQKTITGKRNYQADHLKDQPLPSAGSPLTIYYYDQKLWHVL